MPLTSGTKLGPYEIQSPLGAGGMGEVYRAIDTRLNRTVAIKVLASHLSNSPELKQRMEREARTISSLNHPHICQLYDIGSQDGTDYLVMEFLEGETLAERLRKSPISLVEIYKIGIAVAEGLAIAHRQGIVHRDLKPGNIMLTPAGAKLMDFGLAKPLSTPSAGSATAPPSFTAVATLSGPSPLTPLTTAGSIIGTIQYMAPEQIEGKEADARSDIFAFGAVLYEMATGKRPFQGKSQISLASAILEHDPAPISAVKPVTPPAFEHVVTTCLQKNPEDRYQTAHDIKLELQWIAADKSSPAAVPLAPRAPARRPFAWIVAIVAALVLGALAGLLLNRPRSSPQSIRTVINPPDKVTISLSGDQAGPPVLSPDGSSLAFTGAGSDGKTLLWIRPMNSMEARSIPGTDGAVFPFWSPDGRFVAFFADAKLKTVELTGGTPLVVCDSPFGRGGAWSPSGVILFSPGTQAALLRVNSVGGAPASATTVDTTQHTSHRWPVFLPDGKHYLYLAIHHDPSKSSNNAVFYASLDGKENRLLVRSQSNAIYAAGFLLFARSDQLMAQPFDAASGKLSGEPQIVAPGVMNDSTTWHMDASASDEGLLVYGTGGRGDWQLVWMDRAGRQISTIADKLSELQLARLSPQGDRIALQLDNGANDIWVLDLTRGVRTRLTFGPVSNSIPVWSPDGKWIAYNSSRNGTSHICRKPSDGSGAEELLVTDDAEIILPSDWTPDGKQLFYSRGNVGSRSTWILPLEGDRKPRQIITHGSQAKISPDGHWLSYSSTESGRPEVYVVPFGGEQGKWQVSANGGTQSQWSKDGKELYYLDPAYNIFAVPVKGVGGAAQFGAPETIVATWSAPQVFYDVSPDGKRILLDRVSQQVSQSVSVVTNFTSGLKK